MGYVNPLEGIPNMFFFILGDDRIFEKWMASTETSRRHDLDKELDDLNVRGHLERFFFWCN